MSIYSTCQHVYDALKTGMNISGMRCTAHFNWSEFLVHQTEIPSLTVLKNIQVLANKLETVRALCGNRAITIDSGWRSASYNANLANRGYKPAVHSLHIQGLAVDFYVKGLESSKVRAIMNSIWQGGMELGTPHVHLDLGPHERFGVPE